MDHYTNQLKHSYIKLYWYRSRWYDPYLNQFVQPDTIIPEPANAANWNRYAYTNYNPIRYSDPSGHFIFEDTWVEPCNANYPVDDKSYGSTYFYSPDEAERTWKIKVPMRVSQQTVNDPSGFGSVIGVAAYMGPSAIQAGITNQISPYSGGLEKVSKYERLDYTETKWDQAAKRPALSPEEILMPGGNPIGEVTRGNPKYRTVESDTMWDVFNTLTVNATDVTPEHYNGITMYELYGGGLVGLRYSKDYGWTLDINISGIPGIKRIHLP